MLQTIDAMRDAFGPMIINTWFSEKLQRAYGLRRYSGLRTVGFFVEQFGPEEGTYAYASSMSQHIYGRAFDALFRDFDAATVRERVRENRNLFPYLTAMELEVNWFHGDCRNTQPLMEFRP